MVLSSMEGTRLVRVPPGPNVWKEFWLPSDSIELGEWVMAWGEPQPDGSLLAAPRKVWASIGKWSGTIAEKQANALVVKRHDGVPRTLSFSPTLDVIHARGLLPVAGGLAALRPGMQIGAVGLALNDRMLRATRIWIDE
ncbi:MAG TPA: hypothetical protein VGR85_12315 [Candidatus Limnocylindria bacterium]|nr:hypothetical protein [Candidatus Limnocylindria bacterium]